MGRAPRLEIWVVAWGIKARRALGADTPNVLPVTWLTDRHETVWEQSVSTVTLTPSWTDAYWAPISVKSCTYTTNSIKCNLILKKALWIGSTISILQMTTWEFRHVKPLAQSQRAKKRWSKDAEPCHFDPSMWACEHFRLLCEGAASDQALVLLTRRELENRWKLTQWILAFKRLSFPFFPSQIKYLLLFSAVQHANHHLHNVLFQTVRR